MLYDLCQLLKQLGVSEMVSSMIVRIIMLVML